MFSLSTRAQGVANTTVSAVSAISVIVAILSVIQLYFSGAWSIATTDISGIKAQALLKSSRSFGAEAGRPRENSKISFDLSADLTPLFNWNTKQVFVYLTAEYDGKSAGSGSTVTYWDKIINDKKDAVLNMKNVKSKYSVWDVEKSFRGRNATLKLQWNVQPWVGPLTFGETTTLVPSSFKFALVKEKSKH